MRDRFFLEQHEWRFLAVDEAHRLKSFNCKLSFHFLFSVLIVFLSVGVSNIVYQK